MINVSDAAGSLMLVIMNWLPKDVNSNGAVSPIMRATASAIPVTTPPLAELRRMYTNVFAREIPSANPPSLIAEETSFNASWVEIATIGIIMKPSAIPPVSAENRCWVATMSS